MKINKLLQEIKLSIAEYYKLSISYNKLNGENGLKYYNNYIIENVKKKTGLYLWENFHNNEIIYIGMVGKISREGVVSNHTLDRRLRASRLKDKKTKKYITTNEYLRKIMKEEKCEKLNIHIIHLNECELNGYFEAVLINKFYQHNKKLPKYNKSF